MSPKPDAVGSGGQKYDPGGVRQNKQKKPYRNHAAKPKFVGACEGLKDHIFDCGVLDQADLFVKTQKAIAIYIGSNNGFKLPGYTVIAVENLEIPTVPLPANLGADASDAERHIWNEDVSAAAKKRNALQENVNVPLLPCDGAM